jgi:hypothetical protein
MKGTIHLGISRGDRQFATQCFDLAVVTQAPTPEELALNIPRLTDVHGLRRFLSAEPNCGI